MDPPSPHASSGEKRVGRVLLEAHHRAVAVTRAHSDAPPGLVVQLPVLTPARDDAVTRPKFGLIAVDHAAGFRREPKPSAYAFQRVAKSGDLSQLR